jgi:hypothetical protein
MAAVLLLAAGSLVTSVALAWHAGRVTDLTRALDGGIVGGLVVTLLGAALAPNAAVWGAAYLAGPGFAVGVGTSVTPGGVTLGPVPALPVLGALPSSGGGGLAWVVLAVPLAAGALAAVVLHRRSAGRPVRDAVLEAVGAAACAGALLAALAAVSGGPVGGGRLASVGPSPWEVGLAVAVEVALAAAVTAALLARRPEAADAPDAA